MPHSTSHPASMDRAKFVTAVLWVLLGSFPVGVLAARSAGFSLPGLSLAVAGLTLFVGALVATYSLRYMRSDARSGRFFASLAGLLACVLLFVFTGHAVLFALAWVSSGLLLARLIGHDDTWSEARAAAGRSRRVFLLGDLAVLTALGLLCWNAGTFQLDRAIGAVPDLAPPVATGVALLLLAGAAARSALPPFSGWLLSSMTAPTPVSALMHAGLVNAGGFLLLRFAPVLEAAPAVRYAAIALGFFAALWGIGIMAVRPDIKRSLAGSTVSQMGFMIMTCGLGAYAAALWHIVAHGLFKAWLFLNAGSAIGMQASRRPALEPRLVGFVAMATLAIGAILTLGGTAGAELVPMLLAVATAAATMGAIASARLRVRSRLALAGWLTGLLAAHLAGFEVAKAAMPLSTGPMLSPLAALLLLAAFLGGWLWQARRIAGAHPLPAALYVRLLNAGALAPAGTGDRP